jgi:hypothetical protein
LIESYSQQDYLNRRNSDRPINPDRAGEIQTGQVLLLDTLIDLEAFFPTGKDVLRFLHPGRTGFSRGGGFEVPTLPWSEFPFFSLTQYIIYIVKLAKSVP